MAVKKGDRVFAVTDLFDVEEAEVVSVPGDHIYVQLQKRLKYGPRFTGPHRWDASIKGARTKAIALIDEREKAIRADLVALDKQRKMLEAGC